MDATVLDRLSHNDPELLILDLWANNIGDEGARAMADALAKNATLQTLYLWSNNIGSETKAILAALPAQRLEISKSGRMMVIKGFMHDPGSILYMLPCDGNILKPILEMAKPSHLEIQI